ncbi:hypothetical protein [Phormidium tenue]|nr:hypothetical protein [Phormidium tenue]
MFINIYRPFPQTKQRLFLTTRKPDRKFPSSNSDRNYCLVYAS